MISANKRLPRDLCVDSIDDILYSIGLSLTSVRDVLRDEHKNRRFYNKPIVIFVCNLLYALMRIFCLFTDNKFCLTLLGHYGHMLGFNTQCIALTQWAPIVCYESELWIY